MLKLQGAIVENHYYHKIGGCNIMAKCVVDCNKKCTNVLWGFQVVLMIQGSYVDLVYIRKFNTTSCLRLTRFPKMNL